MPRRKNETPSLAKIVIGILAVCAAAFGVVRFADWFTRAPVDTTAADAQAAPPNATAEVEKLLAKGDVAGAETLLSAVEPNAAGPRALVLLADLDQKNGDTGAAKEKLRRATEEFPNDPDQPSAAAAYARFLENNGDAAAANAIYTGLQKTAPPEVRAAALAGLAREEERKNNPGAARTHFEQAFADAPWGSGVWFEALEGLGNANVAAIFSAARTPDSRVYTVAAGDSITSIGNKLNTTQGLLLRANGMDDADKLRLGQNLKYTPKDFRVIVERSTCRVYLLDGTTIFNVYRTGLGKENHETTLGRYKIGNKQKDPTWHKPGAGPIPPGDPANELGTRWMPLVPEEEGLPTDLGIHGTIQPNSIGKYESMGCPRMHNADVEELYDLIVRSTPADVVEVFTPEILAQQPPASAQGPEPRDPAR